MSQPDAETRRLQFLLTSLIVVVILILAVVFLILAYPSLIASFSDSSPTPLSTDIPDMSSTPIPSITLTPTLSATLRPSLTPTITATPTRTSIPSSTPTPPGPPTLTPAIPVIGDPYELVDWTPEDAEAMIALMEDYPNTLPEDTKEENLQLYFDSYLYATIAQQESLLRFPDAPQADDWRWQLAYDLARIDDPQASEVYGELITTGLNRDEVDILNLSDWFTLNEPRLSLYVIELDPIPGYIRNYLIDIRGPGSSYILVLEIPGAYQYYVLQNQFDFITTPETRSLISDLNGDTIQEIGIYLTDPTDSEFAERPAIYNLAEIPASQLEFRPSTDPLEIGMDFQNYWGVSNTDGGNELFFKTRIYPACPVEVNQDYRWGGLFFELIGTDYLFEPTPQTISYCEFLAEHIASTWGYAPAIQLMEILLPDWPPEINTKGDPYPPEAIDEWRYWLGIFHAQLGNSKPAIEYLQSVITNPGDPGSTWVSQADAFLELYNQPDDLYRACTQVVECNANDALLFLINDYERESDQETIEFLWDSGVTLRASGYYDFDQDGKRERWLTVQNRPLEGLELWILAQTREGDKLLYVAPVESSKPRFETIETVEPSVVLVDGNFTIRMERDPDTTEPYLVFGTLEYEYISQFIKELDMAQAALFAGEDPEVVVKMLEILEDYPGLLCEPTWTCDQYYYLLGLAYELAGDDRNAIEAYLYLWWNYSKSPYTTMARLKLRGTITPVATAIQTPPVTTPTPTGLPGLTPTPGGPYPYPSPTATSLPYPFPTPTIPSYP